MMRAAFYRAYGSARDVLQVGALPVPSLGRSDVRVRIAFSGVNPSDCNRRRGHWERLENPLIIPHNDGSGIIEEVGGDVDRARVGERVWIWNGQRDGRTLGTAAEHIVLDQKYAVRLPDNVSLEEGACFGVPAITAYASLFDPGPLTGKRVLVTGAAGSVGHYAAQFARLAGASQVIATVSNEAKAAHAARANPDVILNYREDDMVGRIMAVTDRHGVDRISEVNYAANAPMTADVAAKHAWVGVYGSKPRETMVDILKLLAKHVAIRYVQCNIIPPAFRNEATKAVTAWAAAGHLIHTVARVYPLEEIVAAHEAVESGTVIGNVLVRP